MPRRRVRHDGIIATVELGRLLLMTETAALESLQRAKRAGVSAIKSLPETPLTAAGFNLRFRFDSPPDELLRGMNTPIDNRISDGGFSIRARSLRRSLALDPGLLNVEVRQPDGDDTVVELNFHRQSTAAEELCSWLEMPDDRLKDAAQRAFACICGSDFKETLE